MSEIKIKKWLEKYNFDVNLDYDDDFAYDIEQNTIIIGLEEYPLANKYFQQFLYEYGLKYLDIDDDILSFLHELGHMVTLKSFSQTELKLFRFMKESDENDKDSQKKYYHYWSVPDEFAANIWAINFINAHIDAIGELCEAWGA